MTDQNILEKIKKILAHREQNKNEGESANAAALVQELLIKYNVSEEEVNAAYLKEEEKFTHEYYRKHMEGRNVNQWKINLLWPVANANLCQALVADNGSRIIWYGKKSNMEVAQYLYETLISDIERFADKGWETIETLRKMEQTYNKKLFEEGSELRWVHGKTWKNSFCWGAVQTISKRLAEGMQTLKQDNKTNALIVLSDKELTEYVENLNPHLKKKRHATWHSPNNISGSYSGFRSGQNAGKSIQFKRGINGAGGSAGPALLKG